MPTTNAWFKLHIQLMIQLAMLKMLFNSICSYSYCAHSAGIKTCRVLFKNKVRCIWFWLHAINLMKYVAIRIYYYYWCMHANHAHVKVIGLVAVTYFKKSYYDSNSDQCPDVNVSHLWCNESKY